MINKKTPYLRTVVGFGVPNKALVAVRSVDKYFPIDDLILILCQLSSRGKILAITSFSWSIFNMECGVKVKVHPDRTKKGEKNEKQFLYPDQQLGTPRAVHSDLDDQCRRPWTKNFTISQFSSSSSFSSFSTIHRTPHRRDSASPATTQPQRCVLWNVPATHHAHGRRQIQ